MAGWKTSPYVYLHLVGKPQASCTPYTTVPRARPTKEIDWIKKQYARENLETDKREDKESWTYPSSADLLAQRPLNL